MNIFYSPKNHIKKLWLEIEELAKIIGNTGGMHLPSVESGIKKREALIQALIDCYLDPDEDEDFIEEYKP